MKKLLLLLVAMLPLIASAQELKPVATTTYDHDGRLLNALDVTTNTVSYAHYYVEGLDVIVQILGSPNMEVKETLTFKNALQNTPGADKNDVEWIDLDDSQSIIASKGFFTNEDVWCIAVPEWDRKDDYTYIGKEYIYTSDGRKLGYFSTSTNGDGGLSFCQVPGSEEWMLVIPERNKEGQYRYTFLKYVDQPNGIKQIPSRQVKSEVRPNPIKEGETITVELGRETLTGASIVIYDAKGAMVNRLPLEVGTSSVKVPAEYATGNYLYTVFFGNGDLASGKFIVE